MCIRDRDKAKATKIVSDLRSAKAGALMYYADKNVWPDSSADLLGYVDNPGTLDLLTVSSNDGLVWVGQNAGTANSKMNEKLEELRTIQKVGIYGPNKTSVDLYDKSETSVYMIVGNYE
jgi:general secretion pathway protein G